MFISRKEKKEFKEKFEALGTKMTEVDNTLKGGAVIVAGLAGVTAINMVTNARFKKSIRKDIDELDEAVTKNSEDVEQLRELIAEAKAQAMP